MKTKARKFLGRLNRRTKGSEVNPLPTGSHYGRGVHAANEPTGTSLAARRIWDEVVAPSPNAIPGQRPPWFLKTGGREKLSQNFLDEIGERDEAGYDVIFTNKKRHPRGLKEDLQAMKANGAIPFCISYGNEPDKSGKATVSPSDLKRALADAPSILQELRADFGVPLIAAPALASFRNAMGDYGKVYAELFGQIPDVASKVHSYGHTLPEDIVQHRYRERVLHVQGLPDYAHLYLEESANAFTKEGDMVPQPEVVGMQAADFTYAMVLAGAQAGIGVGHFMLEHHDSPNDLAGPHGELRLEAVRLAMTNMRGWGSKGILEDLKLDTPKGKSIDPRMLPLLPGEVSA